MPNGKELAGSRGADRRRKARLIYYYFAAVQGDEFPKRYFIREKEQPRRRVHASSRFDALSLFFLPLLHLERFSHFFQETEISF